MVSSARIWCSVRPPDVDDDFPPGLWPSQRVLQVRQAEGLDHRVTAERPAVKELVPMPCCGSKTSQKTFGGLTAVADIISPCNGNRPA